MATNTEALSSQVATLYLHSSDWWSEFENSKDDADQLKARMTTIPIVHRLSRNASNRYETCRFTVNDVLMQQILIDLFEDYQGFDLHLEGWTFQKPFQPFVHRWDRLSQQLADMRASEDVPLDMKHAINGLVTFLEPVLAPWVKALAGTRATGQVSYQDIWQIFPPSELIVTTTRGVPHLGRITKYEKKHGEWRIYFEKLGWDGNRCGYVKERVQIRHFEGDRYVNSLQVYPVSFHSDREGFEAAMLERGRKFERLRGYHAQVYKGSMHCFDGAGKKQVEGRVIIDAFAYFMSTGNPRPGMRSLDGLGSRSRDTSRARSRYGSRSHSPDEYQPDEYRPNEYQSDEYQPDEYPPENFSETSDSYGFVEVPSKFEDANGSDLWGRNEELPPLTSEQCMIVDPWLVAFEMQTKRWGVVNIDGLSDVAWNYDAFDNLVVPDDEKQLAWDFVESKTTSNEAFDDFIPDKGRGIIILMFGPPGVGKTFTAEAVAERANVPLYSISASALGTEPAEIEQNLDKALQVCKLWNAMLLLDEADVFLAARQSENMKRNELVSLFLTKLEYHPGILFLTTNRASDIDFAFQSRVDLFLPYYELTEEARLKIWKNFINRAGRDGFSSADMEAGLKKLARLTLNGREIKNLVKTTQLLSQKAGGFGSMEKLYFLAEKRVRALKLLAERGA
ncbi:hypothetical protein KVR01_004767 [Diaporthe batatas]|uniref:uncharacterized protein n=1 Tax=Diaporthe batatas TaxID=748121 RepID=UPI001D051B86|nr:uncharacterized protein KVR01_004767 [Diaporthe batatas]KAG8166215.1 hypothetical protein KVR01_004767 [Diaporthe batatas]